MCPPDSVCHPWRRYFARAIDLLICGDVWLAVYALGFGWGQPDNPWALMFNTYVGWSLLFLMEPLCLHFWGTTPGKAVFGISIRDEKGEKLTWREALLRTWQVFGQGVGYGIPFYNLWRLWKSYKACQEGEREPWEDAYLDRDGWETYKIADDRTWRCWICIGVYILDFGLTALILAQAMMPPNRGGLTEAEFYENYNFYADLEVGGSRPDWNDQWGIPDSFRFVIGMSNGLEDELSVTLTDGVVTGVTVVYRGETDDYLWLSNTSKQLALLAFAGSLPEVNCINFKLADWMESVDRQTGWDYGLTLRGLLHVTQSTELDGFEGAADVASILHAREGQTAVFYQEFRIELAENVPGT